MTRWSDESSARRGDTYDLAWEERAAAGESVHGEADLVRGLLARECGEVVGTSVLDAGCGTGRVAIELARHGVDVVGIDLDASMLDRAREKAPELPWRRADLSAFGLGRVFDLVVLAGNVMIFVEPGTETAVIERCAAHVRPDGLLVLGFQLRRDGYDLSDLDIACRAAGLEPVDRWAGWHGEPWETGSDYAVSVFRRHR